MGAWIRSRVGLAIIGAIIIGGLAAVIGFGSVWHPVSPVVGAVAQGDATATTTATAATESTETPEATVTQQPTATATPRIVPTPTIGVGSTLRGTVAGPPGSSSFTMTRNGVTYTIQVNGATQYSGAATQLSGLKSGYRVTIRIAAVYESHNYLASSVASSIDN